MMQDGKTRGYDTLLPDIDQLIQNVMGIGGLKTCCFLNRTTHRNRNESDEFGREQEARLM